MQKNIDLEKLLDKAGIVKNVGVHKNSPLEELSMRELQILIAISTGTTPADASNVLGISPKSFSTYRARIMEKLNLRSNAQLAVLSFELGLVPSVLEKLRRAKDVKAT